MCWLIPALQEWQLLKTWNDETGSIQHGLALTTALGWWLASAEEVHGVQENTRELG